MGKTSHSFFPRKIYNNRPTRRKMDIRPCDKYLIYSVAISRYWTIISEYWALLHGILK